MNYYIKETVFDKLIKHTAGSKAREDINEIAEEMGFAPVEVQYDFTLRENKGVLVALRKLSRDWSRAFAKLGKGDVVLMQYPLHQHPVGIPGMIRKLQKRGGKVIILIHDIDFIRVKRKTLMNKIIYAKVKYEDYSILACGDVVVAHNDKMVKFLADMGVDREKMVTLEIFDYLIHGDFAYTQRKLGDKIIVAGNLRKHKAGYVYGLPDKIGFNLYGVGYENREREGVRYFGSFDPEELTQKMQGSFGLVWDGTTCETCDGMSGKYLRMNNPHKLSLYLSSGLPVIIWNQAATAAFVKKEKAGLTISRIDEIPAAVAALSESDYRQMEENAAKISERLRSGAYTKTALTKALSMASGQGK